MPTPSESRASGLLRTVERREALRNPSSIARRQLEAEGRKAAVAVALANTPIRRLVSRHTRRLLRRYRERGMVNASVADRSVEDRLVPMSTEQAKSLRPAPAG